MTNPNNPPENTTKATTTAQSHPTHHVAFSHAPGIGPRTFEKLIEAFHTPRAAFTATATEISTVITNPKTLSQFLQFRSTYEADRTLQQLITKDIQIILPSLPTYSKAFSAFAHLPICLYARGDVALLSSTLTKIAIIGTRKPTPYGTENAIHFTRELAQHNTIILSGLALGIDALAHKTTLDVHGKTTAILGSGFNYVHPRQNLRLYNEIINKGGLVLTEYAPDTPPLPQNFPVRNRLISGLSKGVLVIEGNAHSGTRITAKQALETGKDVFAIPGPIHAPLSQTPNYLIQEGAHLVDTPQYIIDLYKLTKPASPTDTLTSKLIFHLSHTSSSASQLAETFHTPIHTLLPLLTQLELAGAIRKQHDNTYLVPATISLC